MRVSGTAGCYRAPGMVPPRCGLVGPGRTRDGLGPFLARELEQASARVVAVVGRDAGRSAAAAAELSARLRREVAAFPSVAAMLEGCELDALVVAAPIEAHLPALRAALAAGVSVLCEKPLVAPEEHAVVPELLDAFAARRLVLMENCQLPNVLPAFDRLHPSARSARLARFEMHMAPSGVGRDLVVGSLSHFLSMLQALLPVDRRTRLAAARIAPRGPAIERTRVDLELEDPFPRVQAALYVARSVDQPRPQWFAVNGQRIERRIRTSDYAMSYCSGDRCIEVEDPLAALVRTFVRLLTEPDLERARAESAAIRERTRLYRAVLDAWDD